MRIVQIVPSLEERHGGPSKSVYGLSLALARAGADVELLATAPKGFRPIPEGPMAVRVFDRGFPEPLCPSAGLRARILGSDAEIIHHHSLWLRTLDYAHKGARRSGASLILSPRGMMSPWAWNHHSWRKRISRLLVHPGALESVDGWHATSESEALEIRALGFRQPICVSPNGVSGPEPGDAEKAARNWKETHPETAQRPVALFYSRFHRKKRVIELIDEWLENGEPDWLLLVAGIPQEYSVGMLQDYVLRSGGTGRVAVADGRGRPPPYAIASLFVLPSHNENFGLSIAEALAHGVPAMVTDTTPWQPLNDNGGWCIPWSSFGEALRSATAESAPALSDRGNRCRAWVLQEYSWETSARILEDFYRRTRAERA